jgi:hypothetical protein
VTHAMLGRHESNMVLQAYAGPTHQNMLNCMYSSLKSEGSFIQKDLFDNFAFILLSSKKLTGMNPSKKC